MHKLLMILAAPVLTGCAGMGAYEAQVKIAEHRAVEAKHYADAMWQIAQGGDTTVRTVAAMSLQSKMQGNAGQGFTLAPSPLMQAAQILVPALSQAWAVDRSAKVQMHMSDNSTREALGLYGTFERFAGEINAPTIVTQPAPTIVTQPAPTVVRPEVVRPDIVVQPEPTIVDPRDPVIVEPRDPVIVTQPPPTVITQPAPVIVTPPPAQVVNPIVVNPPPAQVVEPVIVQQPGGQ